jgi:hypothetical protein
MGNSLYLTENLKVFLDFLLAPEFVWNLRPIEQWALGLHRSCIRTVCIASRAAGFPRQRIPAHPLRRGEHIHPSRLTHKNYVMVKQT